MTSVRMGVVGLGNIGNFHAEDIAAGSGMGGKVTLAAVCAPMANLLAAAAAKLGKIATFEKYEDLLASKTCDAVLIATPHYQHVPMTLAAFEAGLHVLVEKPLAVSVGEARRAAAGHKKYPKLKFGIMFNQRSNPMYLKLRSLIAEGELGELSRITWIVTNSFRPNAYYGSSKWRATWKGEGGGVLINQGSHNLDLVQWITGMMPTRVTAVGFIGKTHPIEVEDEVSAVMEYANGAVGHFIITTGEFPGTNRLEICGSRGKIVAEGGKLMFSRVRVDVRDFNRSTAEAFGSPEFWQMEVPYGPGKPGPEHRVIVQEFVNAILNDTPSEKLLAPGQEGVAGLELGSAMAMAGLTRKPVELPLDGAAFDAFLDDMDKKYGGKKTVEIKEAKVDIGDSFKKT